jgi:hypothetical protein
MGGLGGVNGILGGSQPENGGQHRHEGEGAKNALATLITILIHQIIIVTQIGLGDKRYPAAIGAGDVYGRILKDFRTGH